jgi:hypothetical protein
MYYEYLNKLKTSVASLSPRKARFDSGSVHVVFMEDEIALGEVFSQHSSCPLPAPFNRSTVQPFNRCSILTFILILPLWVSHYRALRSVFTDVSEEPTFSGR